MENNFYQLVALNEFTTENGMTYIGKTKRIKKIEKLVDELMEEDPVYSRKSHDILDSPKIFKIQKLFEEEFGFKKFYLSLLPSIPIATEKDNGDTKMIFVAMNSGTSTPISMIIRDASAAMPSLLFNKDKFYDYKHNYLCNVVISTDMFDKTKFTAEEIVAVWLHEIGHNFDVSITTQISGLINLCSVVDLAKSGELVQALTLLFKNYVSTAYMKFFHHLFKYLPSFVSDIGALLGECYKILASVKIATSLFRLKELIVKVASLTPSELITTHLSFGAERFADSFVTLYGYGPAFVSYTRKYELYFDLGYRWNLGRPFNNFVWFGSAITSVLYMIIDSHPESQTRCKLILDDYKKLSENENFPVDIRKAIKKDYDRAKLEYDKYMEIDPADRRSLCSYVSKSFKEQILDGKVDLRSYIMTCSAIQSGVLTPTKKGARK